MYRDGPCAYSSMLGPCPVLSPEAVGLAYLFMPGPCPVLSLLRRISSVSMPGPCPVLSPEAVGLARFHAWPVSSSGASASD